MAIFTALFTIWAGLVGFWWLATNPTSAPQQAALAGQVIVLIVVPYAVLASIQRAMAAAQQGKLLKIMSLKNDEESTQKNVELG